MIGINTAISTQNGGYQGVGFAIPRTWPSGSRRIDRPRQGAPGLLGVAIQQSTRSWPSKFGAEAEQGVLVADVQPNTPPPTPA